jgi:hypothetical protein
MTQPHPDEFARNVESVPPARPAKPGAPPAAVAKVPEIGGPKGPEPTRYGDWERAGRCIDF